MNIDRIIEGLPWGAKRTSRLALDFARDFVSLFEQQANGNWTCIGSAALSAPDFSKQIDGLRIEALMRDKHRTPVTLWLPEDQVLCRHYNLMDRHGVAAKAEALRKLTEDSEYTADELVVSVADAVDGEPVAVLAAMRQTVIEASQYAERWGFVPGTASTRAYTDVVGTRPPEFLLHETISARAGRFARGTAMATGALLAVSIGGLGAYYLAAPVLTPPTTVNSTAALDVPNIAGTTQRTAAFAPPGPTWIGQAQHLGLQTAPADARTDLRLTKQQSYSREVVSVELPTLASPETQTAMRVGAIADVPLRFRPSRLVGEVSGDRSTKVAGVSQPPRQDISVAPVNENQDVAKPSTNTDVGKDQVQVAAIPARQKTRSLYRNLDQVAVASADVEEATPSAETAETQQPEDVATEFAPKTMSEPPASRPVELALATSPSEDANDDARATDDSTDEATVADAQQSTNDPEISRSTDAADPTAEIDVTSRIGRSQPGNEDVASLGAPALAVVPVPVPGQRLAAPGSDLDASALNSSTVAALSAPRPLTRPRNLITIKPTIKNQSSNTPRIKTGTTLQNRPIAPRTVRAAATQHGLELGQASLIGVIEAQNGRKALVRLPTGDYRKVERGDVLDGWRVGTVGRETLRLTRRGQNRTLILVTR